MAAFHCSACDLNFPFQSKLDRHMRSDGHLMFVESQKQETHNSDLFSVVHSSSGEVPIYDSNLNGNRIWHELTLPSSNN